MTISRSRDLTAKSKQWIRLRRSLVWRRAILLATVGAVASLLLCRSLWLPLVGDFLIVDDPLTPADAVVALGGGGRDRVSHATLLFDQGYADWFVVTNARSDMPGIRASYGELMQQEAIWQGVPEQHILIAPGIAETTYDEAVAMRRLAQEQGWRFLIVVTDPFHTRRARMAFREAFEGSHITVAIQPVNEHWYQPSSWWQSRDGLRQTWTEYAKLVLHLIGYK